MDPIEMELQKKYSPIAETPQAPTTSSIDPIEQALASKYNQQIPSKPDFIDKVGEFGTGASASLWKTMGNVSGFVNKKLGLGLDMELPKELTTAPETKSGKLGAGFGELIQYFTPVGAESAYLKSGTLLDKVILSSPRLRGLAKLATKSTIGGAEMYGKGLAISGDEEEAKSMGILGATLPPALKALGKTGKFAINDLVPAVAGVMTGLDPKLFQYAFNNPEKVALNMARKVVPYETRTKAVNALNNFRRTVSKDFEKGLKQLKTLSPTVKQARTEAGPGYPGVFSGVKKEFENILTKSKNNLPNIFRKFRISVQDNGATLDFEKLNSPIVNEAERRNIQRIWDTFRNQENFSVQSVQDVAAKINALSKFQEGMKTAKSAVVSEIHNAYSDAIKKVYPKLYKLRKEYETAQKMIQGIDDVIKSNKGAETNPVAATGVTKKLVNLFHEDNDAYVAALKKLENVSGEDLVSEFVASNFDQVLPGKLGSYLTQVGLLVGTRFNPLTILALPLTSPRVGGKIITTMGKAAKSIEKLEPLKKFLPFIAK
jgi:hypothetical protein